MSPKKALLLLVLTVLSLSFCSSAQAVEEHPPIGFLVFCNPSEVSPGVTLYGEAVVSNGRPHPVSFVIWGGIFVEDELVLEIEPIPGFLYAQDEHLFPIPIQIPEDFEIGLYRLELFVGPNPDEVWKRDGRPFMVKFPPPVRAALETLPGTIRPWQDFYANLLIVNVANEDIDLDYNGVIRHHNQIVAEIEGDWVTLGIDQTIMIPILVDLPDDLLPGRYEVLISIGQEELRWMTVKSPIEVTMPSPVRLGLFVDPARVIPGGVAWTTAILRNDMDERVSFLVWGAVTHEAILYLEFAPIHVVLEPGQERLLILPIQIVDFSPFGLYRVRLAIGPEVGRDWMTADEFFWVRDGIKDKPPQTN
jgi:hypothetical protein